MHQFYVFNKSVMRIFRVVLRCKNATHTSLMRLSSTRLVMYLYGSRTEYTTRSSSCGVSKWRHASPPRSFIFRPCKNLPRYCAFRLSDTSRKSHPNIYSELQPRLGTTQAVRRPFDRRYLQHVAGKKYITILRLFDIDVLIFPRKIFVLSLYRSSCCGFRSIKI